MVRLRERETDRHMYGWMDGWIKRERWLCRLKDR